MSLSSASGIFVICCSAYQSSPDCTTGTSVFEFPTSTTAAPYDRAAITGKHEPTIEPRLFGRQVRIYPEGALVFVASLEVYDDSVRANYTVGLKQKFTPSTIACGPCKLSID